jgi:hypothetical protein
MMDIIKIIIYKIINMILLINNLEENIAVILPKKHKKKIKIKASLKIVGSIRNI